MSKETTEDGSISSVLSEPIDEWLAATAQELGLDRDELLRRLLTAHWAAEQDDVDLERLDARIEALEDEFDEKLDDVRDRVIQVKRETDTKAPADHAHVDLHDAVETMADRVGRATDRVDTLRGTVDDLDDRLDEGFENYETVVEHLTSVTDDIERKLDTLARAVVDTRELARTLADATAERAAVDALAETANRNGVRRAMCEACGSRIDIGLLTAPRCPHCNTGLRTLDSDAGWLRSGVLRAGTHEALEDRTVESDDEGESELTGLVGADDASVPDPPETLGTDSEPESDLTSITGIGTAYADRLENAGVETVAQLAAADPDELAEAIDVSAARIEDWIDRSRQRLDTHSP